MVDTASRYSRVVFPNEEDASLALQQLQGTCLQASLMALPSYLFLKDMYLIRSILRFDVKAPQARNARIDLRSTEDQAV